MGWFLATVYDRLMRRRAWVNDHVSAPPLRSQPPRGRGPLEPVDLARRLAVAPLSLLGERDRRGAIAAGGERGAGEGEQRIGLLAGQAGARPHDRYRALEQLGRVGGAAEGEARLAQPGEEVDHVGVIGREVLVDDRERLRLRGLGLAPAPLRGQRVAQLVEVAAGVVVLGADRDRVDGEGPAQLALGPARVA